MDNLPEDQQRNDSPPSSPEPEGAVAMAPGVVGKITFEIRVVRI